MLSQLRKSAIFGAAALLSLGTLSAQVVINEVYYDAPGSDNGQVFVELYGPAGTDLTGWSIVGIEGGSASSGGTCNPDLFTFPAFSIPADGVVVVADESGGTTSVANWDFLDSDMDLENGADAVVLTDASGTVVDAVAYGSVNTTNTTTSGCTGVSAGEPWYEGNPARDVFAPLSIERCPAGVDTGDNDADFTPNTPTPGVANTCCDAMEYVSMGARNNLSLAAGDAVGIDLWTSCAGGGLYLIVGSFVDPAVTPPPAGLPVWGPATPTLSTLANIPPFVAWGGTLPANGRMLGTAALDFSSFAGLPALPAPVPVYVGAVGFNTSTGQLTQTNYISITLN